MKWQGTFLLPVLYIPAFTLATEVEQGILENFDWQANVRAGYFSKPNQLNGDKNILSESAWLRLVPHFKNGNSIVIEGVARRDDSSRESSTRGRIREAYLNLGADDTDIRVGKQIIAWGRADRLNPTDNLTPHDYSWLSANDDDQRTGAWSAKVRWHPRACSVTGVWLMRLAPNVIPIAPIQGVDITEHIPRQASQGALKLDCSGGALDWSMSYFNGLDLNPDLRLGSIQPSRIGLVLTHQRIKVLGLDGATALGRYGLRAEAAYAWTAYSGAPDDTVKRPFLYLVAGGDRSFDSDLNVNIQYYVRHVTDYRDPALIIDPVLRVVAMKNAAYSNQTVPTDQGFAFRINKKWMEETLDAELRGQFSTSRKNYAVKARLTYAFDDRFKGTVGMNLYGGSPNTLFDDFREMSAIMAELRYDF